MTGSLDVVEAHALRARPTASRNNPNLSDYACTCGEEFISSDLAPSTPYGTPSLARAHRLIVFKEAAGIGPEQIIVERSRLAAIPETAVVTDADGRLLRRWDRQYLQWQRQDGTHTDQVDDIALPISVWWLP